MVKNHGPHLYSSKVSVMHVDTQLVSECAFQPTFFTRKETQEQCPWLIQLEHAIRNHPGSLGYRPHVFACLALEGHVAPLLDYVVNESKPVLLFSLPDKYEPHLAALVVQSPMNICLHARDLLHAVAADMWSPPEGSDLSSLCVEDQMLEIAFSWASDRTYPGQRCEIPSFRQTVIMLSGETVAVGGFWVTEDEIMGRQGASSKAANWNPHAEYTPEELAEAKRNSPAGLDKDVLLHFDARASQIYLPCKIRLSTNETLVVEDI